LAGPTALAELAVRILEGSRVSLGITLLQLWVFAGGLLLFLYRKSMVGYDSSEMDWNYDGTAKFDFIREYFILSNAIIEKLSG